VLAGLFFAAQPMQVGAAAWIGGRTDALSALFLSALLVSLVLYHQTSKRSWLITAVGAFFLAALSKEQAVAILPAIALSVFVFGKKNWREVGRLSAPFLGVLVVYAGLWVLGAPAPHAASNTFSDTIMLALRTAAHYGLAFIAPNEPSLISFTLENYRSFLWIPLGALFVAGCGLMLREGWKKNRTLAWLGICALLVYIPISNCPTVPSFVLGPYRCGESGVCVACLLGIGTALAVSANRIVWTSLFAANLIAGGAVTWWGVHQWLNPMDFFGRVVKNDPHFVIGAVFYAHCLDDQGRSGEAAQITTNTLDWLFGSDTWAETMDRQGKAAITPLVMRHLRANSGIPNIATLGTFIATNAYSLARSGQVRQAAVVARDALVILPKDTWINFLYGRLVLRTDRSDALRHWEEALKVNPNYGECAIALAHERIVDRRYPEAVNLLTNALKLYGNDGYGWLDLADAKIALKDFSGARSALDHAQTARRSPKPQQIEARRKVLTAMSQSARPDP